MASIFILWQIKCNNETCLPATHNIACIIILCYNWVLCMLAMM